MNKPAQTLWQASLPAATAGGALSRRRGGFAMLMVLILLGMSVVLGLTYLASASLNRAGTANVTPSGRARCLAESGLEHAQYLMQMDATVLKDSSVHGPYYLDSSTDNYSFYVVPDTKVAGNYLVVATGSAGGLKTQSSLLITRQDNRQQVVQQGMLIDKGTVWLPPELSMTGNIQVNGTLYNYASIKGNVSATGTVYDTYGSITGTKTSKAAVVTMPTQKWDDYKSYWLFGSNFNCVQKKDATTLDPNGPVANGGAVTISNPGGVVWLQPKTGTKVTIPANFTFKGTLIIDGDIVLDGNNIKLTAVDGFPAIMATGRIYVTGRCQATINGLVDVAYGISSQGSGWSTGTTINGGVISHYNGYDWSLLGTHILNYDPKWLTLYDVAAKKSSSSAVQLTLLSWEKGTKAPVGWSGN